MDCDGSYECTSEEHARGCLSGDIDPPSKFWVTATDVTDDATLDKLVWRGLARVHRDEP